MSCCLNNLYNDTFDHKKAQEELENYRKIGPKKNSLPLIEFLKKLNLEDASILDIGSGVGAIIFELFGQKISKAVYNDFSSAYSEAFLEEVVKRGLKGNVECFVGDFLLIHEKVEKNDLVCLDKVICCYEDYEKLVAISVQKAKKWYAFSVPRDVWWVKLGHYFEQKIKWIKGNPFQTYVHPVDEIKRIISTMGFKKICDQTKREWQYFVFERMK